MMVAETGNEQFEKAQFRQFLTLEIADALSQAAVYQKDAEAEAVADMMIESAKDENLFVAEGLDFNDDISGERRFFDGYGSLNIPSSRANPAYVRRCAVRSRKRIEAAISRVKPKSGEKLRFITLTLPNEFGFDFESGYELLTRAIIRLKNHEYFKKNFVGGCISDEFTLGERGTHFHFHVHILGYTKWLDFDALRDVWTRCLQKAALGMGRILTVNTVDGLANVNIKEVKPRVSDEKSETTRQMAIRETCKYTVKGTEFAKIPPEYICQVERALRGRRLVETFGAARKAKPSTGVLMVLFAAANRKPQIFWLCLLLRWYLDKNVTTPDFPPQTVDSKEKPQTIKVETLRQKGARLIRAGRRAEWKRELTEVFAERREIRKKKLAHRFKYATFRSLSGEIWSGISVSDDEYNEHRYAVRGEAVY